MTIATGTGIGKTTFVREIAYHLHTQGERLGLIMLKSPTNGVSSVSSVYTSTRTSRWIGPSQPTMRLRRLSISYSTMSGTSTYTTTSVVPTSAVIIQRITYMAKALGVRWVILDHVSILVSGLATNDERKLIDLALTELRSEVVQELGIGLIIVSHLRRPEGDKGHEDGAKVRRPASRITQHSSAIRHVRGVVCRCRRPRQRHPHHLRTQEQIHRADIGFRWDRRYHRDTGRLLEEGERF